MGFMKVYEQWCSDPYFDEDTRTELLALAGQEAEIEDRFYRQLEFGTGSLRGGDRCRDEPDEYLYRAPGDAGAGKLCYLLRRAGKGRCDCL